MDKNSEILEGQRPDKVKEEPSSGSECESLEIAKDGEEDAGKEEKEAKIDYAQESYKLLLKVKELIEQRLEYDEAKEKAFDKLYEEMKRYKEMDEALNRQLKPILNDLILLYDSMEKFEKSIEEDKEDIRYEELKGNYNYLIEELLEVLYRQDVVLVEDKVDETQSKTLNPKTQKAIKVIPTDMEEEDYLIGARVRRGFMWKDKVLRPEEVIIKRYIKE